MKTNHKKTATGHTHVKHTAPKEKKQEPKFPKEEDQAERLTNLVKDVKAAFASHGFSVPGDLELQLRSMVLLEPHHELPAEQRIGPGAAADMAAA